MARVLTGLILAVILHAGILLFGGWFFLHDKKDESSLRQVELVSEAEAAAQEKKKEEKPKEPAETRKDDVETQDEKPPDAAEMIRDLNLDPAASAPALDAASLSAIENSLFGGGDGGFGDFGGGFDFSSGGRINGTGKGGPLAAAADDAFNMAEIDQKPRAVFQAEPRYPSEMRGRKLEGAVTLIFLVDADGKVKDPRVEKSNDPAFEKPALDALKQWKFEPAIRGGERVECRSRITIRFPAN